MNIHACPNYITWPTAAISSVSELDAVDCCRTTKIDRPPWIGYIVRVSTRPHIRATIAVISQAGLVVATHAALISRSVQRCVVG